MPTASGQKLIWIVPDFVARVGAYIGDKANCLLLPDDQESIQRNLREIEEADKAHPMSLIQARERIQPVIRLLATLSSRPRQELNLATVELLQDLEPAFFVASRPIVSIQGPIWTVPDFVVRVQGYLDNPLCQLPPEGIEPLRVQLSELEILWSDTLSQMTAIQAHVILSPQKASLLGLMEPIPQQERNPFTVQLWRDLQPIPMEVVSRQRGASDFVAKVRAYVDSGDCQLALKAQGSIRNLLDEFQGLREDTTLIQAYESLKPVTDLFVPLLYQLDINPWTTQLFQDIGSVVFALSIPISPEPKAITFVQDFISRLQCYLHNPWCPLSQDDRRILCDRLAESKPQLLIRTATITRMREVISPIIEPFAPLFLSFTSGERFDPFTNQFLQDLEPVFFKVNPLGMLRRKEQEYFGHQSTLKFGEKSSGVQLGNTVEFLKEGKKVKYHVKTHRKGQSMAQGSSSSAASQSVELYELFVYRFLAIAGLGSNAHFFGYNARYFYIATEDVGYCEGNPDQFSVLTYEKVRDKCPNLWKQGIADFPRESSALATYVQRGNRFPVIVSALIQSDIIARIFGLTDLITNPGNLCLVLEEGRNELIRYRIIDFGIAEKFLNSHDPDDLFPLFSRGMAMGARGYVPYAEFVDELAHDFLGADENRRIFLARCLFTGQLFQWIDEAEEQVIPIARRLFSSTVSGENEEIQQLRKQVRCVKGNAIAFLKALNEEFGKKFPGLVAAFPPFELPSDWEAQLAVARTPIKEAPRVTTSPPVPTLQRMLRRSPRGSPSPRKTKVDEEEDKEEATALHPKSSRGRGRGSRAPLTPIKRRDRSCSSEDTRDEEATSASVETSDEGEGEDDAEKEESSSE